MFNGNILHIISKICPQRRTFDTKVLITIGFLRWLFNYQREEIQTLFEARGVDISTGEISRLSEEFLLRFYVFHKKHSSRMKKLFEKNGGIVLHLDGTAEAGDEITFTAKEGITGITIDSWIMPSEGREYIKPFLINFRDIYGTPLAVVRDMWDEITHSVSEVFQNVPQQICHYHFVRNLGSIIFKHRYEGLRRTILNTKVLAQLISLKEVCLKSKQYLNKIMMAQHYWVMLAIEYILYPRERKSDYPFTLPYLQILDRIIEVKTMIRKIVLWNAAHNFGVRAILILDGKLRELIETPDVKMRYSQIKRIWMWFEEVRKTLKVCRGLSEKEQNNMPTSAYELKRKLEIILTKIESEGREFGGELQKISEKICENCRRHSEELFVEIKDNNGKEIKIVRHNGIEELNHRWSRMHIRRRTGRNRTTKEMTKYGALLAVLSNLKNENYIKNVLADVDDFVRELQNITDEEIQDAKKLIRKYPRCPLVYSDSKRPELLQKFIKILEDSDEVSEGIIMRWLSTFKSQTLY